MRNRILIVILLLSLASPIFALHIVPDQLGDVHFTSGPCPLIAPPDGALCPNGAATCPAFYNPALLPAGYNSVSYCAQVPGKGFGAPGFGYLTIPLTTAEQAAFLKAAAKVESYVLDNVTVTVEVYKVVYLDRFGNNYFFFLGDEYWNPVCGADALLPPFSNQTPAIVQNADGSYSYQNLPETYTPVLLALKLKNLFNRYPMQLINYLPSYSQINVEWPPYFTGWQAGTGLAAYQVNNFLVGTSNNYPITPGAKPFTLCGSPAAMKMLGLSPFYQRNGHTIDDFNSPQYNANVTLPGTYGAVVVPDLTRIGPPYVWTYDTTQASVIKTQLPKAYYQHANFALPNVSCGDPASCIFPLGFSGGYDLIGVFNHELNHVLGVMQSQYYKVPFEGTALAYTYGTALYLLDLFDLDSDSVVPGYGSSGIQNYAGFTAAPRNNNTVGPPFTVTDASSAAGLTPWVQFGMHDHLMVYALTHGTPQYFPFMNESQGNPDADIQFEKGRVNTPGSTQYVFIDPNLVNLPELNVVPNNVQAEAIRGTISKNTIREYSELAASGWNIDYSTLTNPYETVSPVAKWYETCFDANGQFTTANNSQCKFSVLPADLKFLK